MEQHINMDFIDLFPPALICKPGSLNHTNYILYGLQSTVYVCMHIYRKIGKHNMQGIYELHTLQDGNEHGIIFSNLAQICQIHKIKY